MKIDYRNKEIINGDVTYRIHDAYLEKMEYVYKKNELTLFFESGFFGEDFEITFRNILFLNIEGGSILESIDQEVWYMVLNQRDLSNVTKTCNFKEIPLENIVDCSIVMGNASKLNIACEEIEFTIKETELSRKLAEENQ